MKSIFTIGFLAVFGTYGLGLVGVLDDPRGLAEFKPEKLELAQTVTKGEQKKPAGHYTLKAMR